jgi:hypothetical protein
MPRDPNEREERGRYWCPHESDATRAEFSLRALPNGRVELAHGRCGYAVAFPALPASFPIAELDRAIAEHLGEPTDA